jgi:hypothetical protein
MRSIAPRPNSSRQAAIARSWDRANELANVGTDGPDRSGRANQGWDEAMARVASSDR